MRPSNFATLLERNNEGGFYAAISESEALWNSQFQIDEVALLQHRDPKSSPPRLRIQHLQRSVVGVRVAQAAPVGRLQGVLLSLWFSA